MAIKINNKLAIVGRRWLAAHARVRARTRDTFQQSCGALTIGYEIGGGLKYAPGNGNRAIPPLEIRIYTKRRFFF